MHSSVWGICGFTTLHIIPCFLYSHLIEYHIFGSVNYYTCYYNHFTWFDTFYAATRRFSFFFVIDKTILYNFERESNATQIQKPALYIAFTLVLFLLAFMHSGAFDILFILVYRCVLSLLTGKTLTLTF